jgi:hypothetical protein
VTEEAVSTTLVIEQVNAEGDDIVTFGIAPLCETLTEAEAVHPLVGSVTTTVYVPAEVTVLLAVFIPLPQLYVTLGLELEAVKVTLLTAQVKLPGGVMLTLGAVTLCVTVVDVEAVHLLIGSVTVTK